MPLESSKRLKSEVLPGVRFESCADKRTIHAFRLNIFFLLILVYGILVFVVMYSNLDLSIEVHVRGGGPDCLR